MEVGTAYPIVDQLVLVARHVVAEHPNNKLWLDIDARKITLTWVNCPLPDGKSFAILPPKIEAEAVPDRGQVGRERVGARCRCSSMCVSTRLEDREAAP